MDVLLNGRAVPPMFSPTPSPVIYFDLLLMRLYGQKSCRFNGPIRFQEYRARRSRVLISWRLGHAPGTISRSREQDHSSVAGKDTRRILRVMEFIQSLTHPLELWALLRFKFGGGTAVTPNVDTVSQQPAGLTLAINYKLICGCRPRSL